MFLTAPEFACQAALKMTKVKLDLLIDKLSITDILLMVEKGITGGVCHAIHQYAKINNKYKKDYDKNQESSYLKHWNVNNLYCWTMPQRLRANNFKWVEDISEFNEDFIKSYNDENDEGYFLEVDSQYPKNLHNFHNDLNFLP